MCVRVRVRVGVFLCVYGRGARLLRHINPTQNRKSRLVSSNPPEQDCDVNKVHFSRMKQCLPSLEDGVWQRWICEYSCDSDNFAMTGLWRSSCVIRLCCCCGQSCSRRQKVTLDKWSSTANPPLSSRLPTTRLVTLPQIRQPQRHEVVCCVYLCRVHHLSLSIALPHWLRSPSSTSLADVIICKSQQQTCISPSVCTVTWNPVTV